MFVQEALSDPCCMLRTGGGVGRGEDTTNAWQLRAQAARAGAHASARAGAR